MRIYKTLASLLILVVIISACSLPSSEQPTQQTNPNAVFTAAAQTVVAQLTQNALLNPTSAPTTEVPPTATLPPQPTDTQQPVVSLPTAAAATSVPTASCDSGAFVSDVTVPDGTGFNAKDTFVKTWRIKNIGTCTWNTSYNLVFDSGNSMGGPASQPLPGNIPPGSTVDISVSLHAPAVNGTYRGSWGLTNAAGTRFLISNGRTFYVEIIVGSGGTPVTTPITGGKFAVTSVNLNNTPPTHTGTCDSGTYTVTANITANGNGIVTYKWIRSDGATDTITHTPLNFTGVSTQSVTTTWTTGGTGLWIDLYIDAPNHQQFGRATLTCP